MFVSARQIKFNVLKTNLFEIVTEYKSLLNCDSHSTHISLRFFCTCVQ